MPTRIVITGATGFIGHAILEHLLARGRAVSVLLRENSDRSRLAGLGGFQIHHYKKLSDPATVAELRGIAPDVFIHCAWRGVGGKDRNEGFQITDNLPFTLDAVNLAAAAGCRQWVGLGSQAEYGNQNRKLSEDAPLTPTTLYGKAKLAAGIAALGLCEALGLKGAWLRVFSTYGPGDAPHWLIPYVIQELIAKRPPRLSACEQLWDYLYVSDAARAIASVANGNTGGVFNLGSGTAHPLKEVIEMIRAEVGGKVSPDYGAVPYRPDQIMHLEADIARLQATAGWNAEVGLLEGIRATIAFEKSRLSIPSA